MLDSNIFEDIIELKLGIREFINYTYLEYKCVQIFMSLIIYFYFSP